VKLKYFIDSHKAMTAIVVFLLIVYYNQWNNPTAWVYLALHGSYGVLWVLKSRIFPDRQWEQSRNLIIGFGIWGVLTLYWIAPWLITSQNRQAPNWYLALCISMYTFGVFFHFTADMQKYISLKLHPNQLITEGLWQRIRNPNYFGELLIYVGFSLLAMDWIPLAALTFVICVVWIPNMIKKDRSLSRYPEFSTYKAHSKWFIPFIL
jgi:steroid 5-alpha reductase family enzyme